MSERVLKVLSGEITKLEKQNDQLTRDINFYFDRIDAYQKEREDNRVSIFEIRQQIDELNGEAQKRRDLDVLKATQKHVLDAAIEQGKIARDVFRKQWEDKNPNLTLQVPEGYEPEDTPF
jgi:uncharacterized coiled-coil DUF342 family protein